MDEHIDTTSEQRAKLLEGRGVSRREFLRIAGIAGATIGVGGGVGGLIAACGGGTTTTSAAGSTTTAGAASTTSASAPTTTSASAPTTSSASAAAEMGREIKLGFPTPLTGAIATFGVPDKYITNRWQEFVGDGLLCGDGKKHPMNFILRDTQSDSNRAAQVTGELITADKVNMVIVGSSQRLSARLPTRVRPTRPRHSVATALWSRGM